MQIPNIYGSYSVSEETRQVLKQKAIEQFANEENRRKHAEITRKAQGSQVGENNRFYGKKHSDYTKSIIREKRKNQIIIMTEERKRKISESNKRTKALKKKGKSNDLREV